MEEILHRKLTMESSSGCNRALLCSCIKHFHWPAQRNRAKASLAVHTRPDWTTGRDLPESLYPQLNVQELDFPFLYLFFNTNWRKDKQSSNTWSAETGVVSLKTKPDRSEEEGTAYLYEPFSEWNHTLKIDFHWRAKCWYSVNYVTALLFYF